jgi:hypothetical protein
MAPAPFAFGFMGTAQEAVMDAHPWTYRVMIQEAGRKGLLVGDARQGSGKIPDPRRFVYVEACAELQGATLSMAVGVTRRGRVRWRESDPGGAAFRVVRSGCFRGAAALSSPGELTSLEAVRFRVFAATAGAAGAARLTRVNRVFVLGSDGQPGPNLFHWSGDVTLRAGADPFTLPLKEAAPAIPRSPDPDGPAVRWEGGGSSGPPSLPAPGSRRRARR